ncbi:MAG: Holliday junction resolvase RuvX [Anaerolineaceae bacterium]|nr:Holliday junction resolvase RuvX [Anaerolineaceae bacterium]MBN2678334.1 Holliday junction resolvase RuvX [Anaerolineaceae bacterium]
MADRMSLAESGPNRRVLAVDPGGRHIGLALSDPTGTVGRPLSVLKHISLLVDAAAIAEIAQKYEVNEIVVGQALDSQGNVGPAARMAARLAETIQTQTDARVVLWDETGTTQAAHQLQLEMGVSRSRRKGHQDALAAAMILKDYLENFHNRSILES